MGIEGIPASNEVEYLHCETPEDYAVAIKKLIENEELSSELSENAKRFTRSHYNYERDAVTFYELIKKLAKGEVNHETYNKDI